ncbi:hypothetical protein LFL96_24655 [Paraburkholderia sp. D15]|uniref:hypothetical protein n=1 Tax=Paraburkholderia sp. D15 TaxID=2880218 RepID=UPI00247A9B97|nr:hypothetical protein [Paraburkholderia sp. D15]WGS54222.1 hypothetical protein LFL96_24655 [Paraburkholderia sp. D15]WKF60236.1 hypothetical protein HUO10_004757 [Paraburkholderia busanensis]
MRIARYTANIAATLLLGVLLARYVVNLPVEWPWLTGSIQFVLHLLGNRDYDNPDDMFDLAGVVILLACLLIVGVAVWLVNLALYRHRKT